MRAGGKPLPAPVVQERADGCIFKVKVLPKSSRNMTAGLQGGALKLKLTAPPVDGAANRLCLAYLAERLGVPKSALDIVTGQTGRLKLVSLHCPPAEKQSLLQRLTELSSP